MVEVQPPSPGLTQAESLAQLERRLPAFALFSRTAATSSRTYVGALNTRTGQTALASSGGMPGCAAYCAEGNALLALGGNPSEVLFTGAVTVRRSAQGALEAVPMPVCVKCQLDYPRSNFLPGARGAPGGSWGD